MITVHADALIPLVWGASDIVKTGTGIRPRRLPRWTQDQISDPGLSLMAEMTAGIRLCFQTNADRFDMKVLVTGLSINDMLRRPIYFDLMINGALCTRLQVFDGHTIKVDEQSNPPAVRFEFGAVSDLHFTSLEPGLKMVELWLPQSATVEIMSLSLPKSAVFSPFESLKPKWAHYGSSISQGMEAAGPSEVWTSLVAQDNGLDLFSFGFSGQCHLDGFIARVIRDLNPDYISLKLGANCVASDSMRERVFGPSVHNFLDIIRERHSVTPIFVISPIFCPLLESHSGPVIRGADGFEQVERPSRLSVGALNLEKVRGLLKEIVRIRRAHGDTRLQYIDGLYLLNQNESFHLGDRLHPDQDAHRLMAKRYLSAMKANS